MPVEISPNPVFFFISEKIQSPKSYLTEKTSIGDFLHGKKVIKTRKLSIVGMELPPIGSIAVVLEFQSSEMRFF
jgi:hypothetical protein